MNRNILLISIYLFLFAASIPWYWSHSTDSIGNQAFILGFPLWFCVSVIGSLAISVYTAVLIAVCWPKDIGLENTSLDHRKSDDVTNSGGDQ